MTGYNVPYGYMGLLKDEWRLFATNAEYAEYFNDLTNTEKEKQNEN